MKLDLFSPKGFEVDWFIFESFFENKPIKRSVQICADPCPIENFASLRLCERNNIVPHNLF